MVKDMKEVEEKVGAELLYVFIKQPPLFLHKLSKCCFYADDIAEPKYWRMMESNKDAMLLYLLLDSEHFRIHLGHILKLFSAAIRVCKAIL